MPGATNAAQQLAVAGFAALWRGKQPRVVELTDDPAVAQSMVAAGRLVLDEEGTLVGVHGLSAHGTRHRIVHGAGTVHTWCALDAIGIPAALGIDADAMTSCPACGAQLRVPIRHGEPRHVGPLRLWLPGGSCAHLVEDFCAHANLYCNGEHLAAVVPTAAAGRSVGVTEVAAIGRQSWNDVTTDSLLSDHE